MSSAEEKADRSSTPKVVTRDDLMCEGPRGGVRRYAPQPGDRVGELTLVRVLGRRRGNGSLVWECACDCGGIAVRTTSALARSVRDGFEPACRACRCETARGRRAIGHAAKGLFWAAMYRRIGTVWPWSSVLRLEASVAAGLDDEDHRAPRDVPMTEQAYQPETFESHGGRQQQAAYLYPLDGRARDAWWMCADCHKPFERGFGCVQCIEPTCIACVCAEQHRCPYEDGMTLLAVGNMIDSLALVHGEDHVRGLSRERVRGIQESALRKLRRSDIVRELAA